MTFLPIVTRELQVRARSRAAYWSRFAVALVGAVICLPSLVSAGFPGQTTPLGRTLSDGLVTAAFMLVCAACLVTADIISSERRQGTLGLLLLTRVNALDVLLGKLASAGLTSLCMLVAFLPMLMIAILAGGVTGGETLRKELVLLDTLFLTLAAGLWASARGQQWLQTGRNALLAVAAFILAPPVAQALLKTGGGFFARLALLSPLGAMSSAADVAYSFSPADYWISLLLVQAAGWGLLFSASVRLRRSWEEEREEKLVSAAVPTGEAGAQARPPAYRPLDDDTNPIVWRLQRQRGLAPILWAGALVGCSHYWVVPLLLRLVTSNAYWTIASPLTLASTVVEGALFAWAASRFFVEARGTGELEILLTTPLGAQQSVMVQWEILKRALRWPLVLMLVPGLLQTAFFIFFFGRRAGYPSGYAVPLAFGQLLGCVNTILSVGALCWLGMWFGLRTGRQGRAVGWTVAIGKGVPYLVSLLCWLILIPILRWPFGRGSTALWIGNWLPQVFGLLLYLFLIRLARRRLLGGLAAGDQIGLDLWGAISSAVRKARHWTPS